MSKMTVRYTGGRAFKAVARGHEVVTDLPSESGDPEAGMTPPELFMASLGTCIGVYAVSYCEKAGFDCTDLTVTLSWEKDDSGSRIGSVSARLALPRADPGNRREAILKAATSCYLHNTVSKWPGLEIELVAK